MFFPDVKVAKAVQRRSCTSPTALFLKAISPKQSSFQVRISVVLSSPVITYMYDNLPRLSVLPSVSEFFPSGHTLGAIAGISPDLIVTYGTKLVGALAILFVGAVIALVVASVVKGILKRTSFDNRIAGAVGGGSIPIEDWISKGAFWGIMLFAVIAALEAFGLRQVSEPLQGFLGEITSFLPRLLGAGVLAALAWLVATVVKTIFSRGFESFGLSDRLSSFSGDPEAAQETEGMGNSLGNLLYWLVWLLFLPLILNSLELTAALGPVNNLTNSLLSALPNIFKAVIIAFVGWIVAKIVRSIVSNFLAALGADQLGARAGLNASGQSLSGIAGTLIFSFILVITAISALTALKIEAITGTAVPMLQRIMAAIPAFLEAGIIMAVAFFIGRFVSTLLSQVLSSIGFDKIVSTLGFPDLAGAPSDSASAAGFSSAPEFSTETTLGTTPALESSAKTPSEIVGVVAFVTVMLFGAMEAVSALNLATLTSLIQGIVAIAGQIAAGAVVFAIGLYLANLAFRLVSMSGGSQSKVLAQAARIAILVLVGAMALQLIGIAPSIINLAFGLLTGAIAVAIAISFGLGGREVAGEQLRDWLGSFKS
ncbi:MAG: mechanosensitive ion channel [Synechococcales cyanobacterium CRU_2_2]|nr:mechanosensitive ion channel [Synechococcales cyanobacterium CRU_2_2]